MKCEECSGRGHFLMPLSTPECGVCGGTGQVSDSPAVAGIKASAEAMKIAAAAVKFASTPVENPAWAKQYWGLRRAMDAVNLGPSSRRMTPLVDKEELARAMRAALRVT